MKDYTVSAVLRPWPENSRHAAWGPAISADERLKRIEGWLAWNACTSGATSERDNGEVRIYFRVAVQSPDWEACLEATRLAVDKLRELSTGGLQVEIVDLHVHAFELAATR